MSWRTYVERMVPKLPGLRHPTQLIALCQALCLSGLAHGQSGFRSAQPAPRLEYWQQRMLTIEQELTSKDTVERARIFFLGDSITDFWLLGDSPWHKDVRYGRAIWDETISRTFLNCCASCCRPPVSRFEAVRRSPVASALGRLRELVVVQRHPTKNWHQTGTTRPKTKAAYSDIAVSR